MEKPELIFLSIPSGTRGLESLRHGAGIWEDPGWVEGKSHRDPRCLSLKLFTVHQVLDQKLNWYPDCIVPSRVPVVGGERRSIILGLMLGV